MSRFPVEEYPHLAELTFEHVLQPGDHVATEFESGLEQALAIRA